MSKKERDPIRSYPVHLHPELNTPFQEYLTASDTMQTSAFRSMLKFKKFVDQTQESLRMSGERDYGLYVGDKPVLGNTLLSSSEVDTIRSTLRLPLHEYEEFVSLAETQGSTFAHYLRQAVSLFLEVRAYNLLQDPNKPEPTTITVSIGHQGYKFIL